MARDYSGTRGASGTRGGASSTSSSGGNAFLLLEIGDFALLETGDKIILDGISGDGDTTTYRSSITSSRSVVT